MNGNGPRGSKYPIFKESGPKNHTHNGRWDQSPSILSTWALWVYLHAATLRERIDPNNKRPSKATALGDKEAVKQYLLTEPVDDMWSINLDMEAPESLC